MSLPDFENQSHTPHNCHEPRFELAGRVHDWRNYVSEEIQRMWSSLPAVLQEALARQAEAIASAEEWD